MVQIKFNVNIQIESGASVNLFQQKYVALCYIHQTTKTFITWNKAEVESVFMYWIEIFNKRAMKRYSNEFILVDEDFTLLIGVKTAQQMQLIILNKFNLTVKQVTN